MARNSSTGITYMHSRECENHDCGKKCNSSDTPWRAWVYSKRDKKKIRRRFATHSAARGWRTDALKAVKDKKLRAPTSRTLRAECEEWLAGAREGRILTRGAKPRRYKPSVLRLYESSLRLRVLPELGDRRLADIDRADLLELKEQMLGERCSASTLRNTFIPLQAVYRRAVGMGTVPVNPTTDLELPTPASRERAATPAQAVALLDTLGNELAPIWATALYAGLRIGELRALRVRNVDLEANTITVNHGWDAKEGEILPKTEAGVRQVFLCETLRPYLLPLIEGRNPDAFVFGGEASTFDPKATRDKARDVCKAENERRQKDVDAVLVKFFLPHEARHSFSTFADHAGISEARTDRYMGHSAKGTPGRYRHLLAGQMAEDAQRLDAYLAGSVGGKVRDLVRPAVG
jgi:integrase